MDDYANGKKGKRMENLADATRWTVNEGDVACEVRIRDVLGPCANSQHHLLCMFALYPPDPISTCQCAAFA